MPRLNQLTFSIHSFMYARDEINFPSTKDIQLTFIDFPNNNVISYVDYFPDGKQSQCHVYSYPFLMEYYTGITNNFPGGLFECVRVVSLCDEDPFEHEFFLRIQKSFPFMEHLSLTNHKPQNRNLSYETKNNNRNLCLVEYSFLNELDISNAHDDYIEQFLFDTKAYLQNNIHLYVNPESLERVTHNFTRADTRINCSKICALYLCDQGKRSSSLKEYFSCAKINYPLNIERQK